MSNPKYKVPVHRFEIVIEILAVIGILYITIIIVLKYGAVPASIPIDYNLAGEPDGWGDKSSLLIIYFVGLVMFAGLSILGRYPHLYNYPVKITEDNIRIQYLLGKSLVKTLNLSLMAIYLILIISGINYDQDGQNLLMGGYFIYLAMGAIFIPIIIYFVLSLRNK